MKGDKQTEHEQEERYGNSLLEVFQIVYLGGNEIEPQDQAGTIKLISDHGFQYLYNAQYVPPYLQPSLQCGDQIMVTVKSPSIRCGQHYFEFDLFSGAYKGTIVIDWEEDAIGEPTRWVKKIQSRDGTGTISLHFGLFPYARVADIEINFIDNSIEDAYGVVCASNSLLQRDLRHFASILFVTDADHPISPELDTQIPLSKSRVAVPLDSTLYVDFLLNCDGKEYKDRLSFECQKDGDVLAVDRSQTIWVKITWGADRDSIISTYNDDKEGLRW